ncbi:sterol desaturase family protein [Acidovorax sp. HDW3]|uniref:sterol desaturase family protein n=1 Tax=Acidovorax sp. HDW3 TaxID=2714923 RepID=UPI001408B99C|nr:sterol desaturase family protein [Acidovorax sp. HDW3]QIL43466.1 sterol desaturase family protein [Acidovorax sp. HDW3]
MNFLQWLDHLFDDAQQQLFEQLVQPLLFALGGGNWLEDAYSATGWLLVGLVQLALMLLVLAPLQRWRPVEPVTDHQAVRTDILYTLIHRLGLFRLALFFTLDPLTDALQGWLHVQGQSAWQLDALWPGVTDLPWVSLLLYLLLLDLLQYGVHRAQHRWDWWWQLHALHHSQRQMTMWTDNRNHLLDDLLGHLIIVIVAQCIGVAPGQFVAIVAIAQLSESLQHANLRLHFGPWGERLWVSPRFHRLHHAIGLGHESGPAGQQVLGGHNFGVLLPWWDMLFGTACFAPGYAPTGIRDQVEPDAQGRLRDYGQGFWQQQKLGWLRLWRRT